MFKYFYYIWNLINSDERKDLFNHLGLSILSAVLYTIIDWQYLILLWFIGPTGTNITNSIIVVQLFTWLVSLSYYYIKYKVVQKQNYFYRLISSRHYKFILTRISNNAPYQWLSEKQSTDLTSQLNATDKGLHYLFTFMTNTVRLVSTMTFSIGVICWNYPYCALIFGGLFTVLYGITKKNNLFLEHNKARNRFRKINNNNNQIISNNISILLDSILHNSHKNIIKNITVFNDNTKQEQMEMYANEDKSYTKIGIVLITGFVALILVSTTGIVNTYKSYMEFFIAALLTYKCMNNNINEICDMLINIRQSEVDFDTLRDIWYCTSTRRRSYISYPITKSNICYSDLLKYYEHHFKYVENDEIILYEQFIRDNYLIDDYYKYSEINYKKLMKSYYLTNKKELVKLENYKDFIIVDFDRMNKFNNYIKNYIYKKEHELYFSYLKTTEITKDKPTFFLYIHYLNFSYPKTKKNNRYQLKYENSKPIIINSNSHILINGPTGSGKSTLLKIIRGIIPLENITANDDKNGNVLQMHIKTDKEKIPINWTNISNSVCYCRQDAVSFISGTIHQILTDDYISDYDDIPDKDINIMKHALIVACVDSKFRNLKFKCTKTNISGGQSKKLILAKGLYRILKDDKQIIILDEVDAGLDLQTAEKVLINLNIIFKEKLLFIAVHTEELKNLFKYKIDLIGGMIILNK